MLRNLFKIARCVFSIFCSSLISQFVFVYLPGRQPFNYYLCTQTITNDELYNQKLKFHWQLLGLQAASAVIQVLVAIKIKLHKLKEANSVHIISKLNFWKNNSMASIDSQEISDVVSNVCNMLIFCTTGIFTFNVNHMNLANANIYPYYLILYFYHLVFPSLIASSLSLVYYCRHAPLRKAIHREIKALL